MVASWIESGEESHLISKKGFISPEPWIRVSEERIEKSGNTRVFHVNSSESQTYFKLE